MLRGANVCAHSYRVIYSITDRLDLLLSSTHWLIFLKDKHSLQVDAYVPSNSVKIETMRASGPGGQNVNKRSTAVRVTHKSSGISVHCMDERFQHLNIQVTRLKATYESILSCCVTMQFQLKTLKDMTFVKFLRRNCFSQNPGK